VLRADPPLVRQASIGGEMLRLQVVAPVNRRRIHMKARIQHIGEWIEHHQMATLLIMVFILAAAIGIRQIYWEYKIATRKPNIRTVTSPTPQ